MGRTGSPTFPQPARQARGCALKGLEIRPLERSDKAKLRGFFSLVSDESIYRRFMYMRRGMREAQLNRLFVADPAGDLALVAILSHGGKKTIVGIGQYFRTPDRNSAEFALLVRDDFQGKGTGTALLTALRAEAAARGIATLTASVLCENAAMLHIADKAGFENQGRVQDGVLSLRAGLSRDRIEAGAA